jgi:hypothetical protein
MKWRSETRSITTAAKFGGVVILLAVLVVTCGLSLSLTSGGKSIVDSVVRQRQWANTVGEFNHLNHNVFEQLSWSGLGRPTRFSSPASIYAFEPTPFISYFYFVSHYSPPRILALLSDQLIALGFHTWDEESLHPERSALKFWKGYACVEIHAHLWDDSAIARTNYKPDSPNETPVSWFLITVQHEPDAIPNAPRPPDSSVFECVPREK